MDHERLTFSFVHNSNWS